MEVHLPRWRRKTQRSRWTGKLLRCARTREHAPHLSLAAQTPSRALPGIFTGMSTRLPLPLFFSYHCNCKSRMGLTFRIYLLPRIPSPLTMVAGVMSSDLDPMRSPRNPTRWVFLPSTFHGAED